MKRLLSLLLTCLVLMSQKPFEPLVPFPGPAGGASLVRLSYISSLSFHKSDLLAKPGGSCDVRCIFTTSSYIEDIKDVLNASLDSGGVTDVEVASASYAFGSQTEGSILFVFSPLPDGVDTRTFHFLTSGFGGGSVRIVKDDDGVLDSFQLTGTRLSSAFGDFRIVQSGSQPGVSYYLLRDGVTVASRIGTGSALDFGVFDSSGTYSVSAALFLWDTVSFGSLELDVTSGLGGANYVAVRTYTKEGGGAYSSDVTYYNGLGLPEQEVLLDAASDGSSLVRPVRYDAMMRPDASVLLPYPRVHPDGEYIPQAIAEQADYYSADSRPFHENTFEDGTSGRLLTSRRPGEVYLSGDRKAVMKYGVSDGTEEVMDLRYSYGASGSAASVTREGYRGEGELRYTMSVSEEMDTSYVFSDVFGRTILRREMSDGVRHDTYFIHDLRDSLVCVLQPEGSVRMGAGFSFGDSFCSSYCFTYRYDDRGNVIEKHVPGGGTEVAAYDMRGRMILRADAQMTADGIYRYILYDQTDRVTQEGYASLTVPIDNVRNAQRGNISVTNFLTDRMVTRTVTYYTADQAPELSLPSGSSAHREDVDLEHCITLPAVETLYEEPRFEGGTLTRGTCVRTRTHFYDSKGRPALVTEEDGDGWVSVYSWENDFAGNVLKKTEEHFRDGVSDRMVTTYTYDGRGRRLTMHRSLNGTDYATVSYGYDDLGRAESKDVDGRGGETYSYTLQGWQETAAARFYGQDVFSLSLRYQLPLAETSRARFGGTVSEASHRHAGQDLQTTGYFYDGLGRLSGTRRHTGTGMTSTDLWTERSMTYDRNGNMTSMVSIVPGTSGMRTVSYSGNRASGASGPGYSASYSYYADGNLRTDSRRDLQFRYNLLNLPSVVTDASGQTIRAEYHYLADGTKISVRDAQNDGFDYRGSFVYAVDGTAGSAEAEEALESVAHDEGRFLALSSGSGSAATQFIDTWHVRDYLGSVRTVLDITRDTSEVNDPALAILEQNDYLPFGTRIDLDSLAYDQSNRYRFNGKEEQTTGGIGLTDYGARYYDNFLPRWTTPDPLAEKYYSISPYAFCNNNPVNFVDPDGLTPRLYIQKSGIGHAFVTSGDGKNTIVYTYGRYGALNESSGSNSGVLTLKGEGVLLRLSGDSAADYLSSVQKEGNFDIFQINIANDSVVSSFYDEKFSAGSSPSEPTKSSFNNPNARVIDTYSLFRNNCVTTSLEGINSSSQVLDADVIAPISLARFMLKYSKENSEVIKIDNPQEFIKDLLNALRNEKKD